jgi:hypothetical protein
MKLVEKYVNVLNPARIEVVLVYRSFDEADDSWGTLWKSHISQHDTVEEARNYADFFSIGEEE